MDAIATLPSGDLGMPSSGYYRRGDEIRQAEVIARAINRALRRDASPTELRIKSYTPFLSAANGWLATVEDRIRTSILPENYGEEPSTEWLDQDAAYAAISFLRASADLLPVEPFIYGSRSGNVVAEYTTSNGSLTTITSGERTILFAVARENPDNPLESVIGTDSSDVRQRVESILEKMAAGANGKVEPT